MIFPLVGFLFRVLNRYTISNSPLDTMVEQLSIGLDNPVLCGKRCDAR